MTAISIHTRTGVLREWMNTNQAAEYSGYAPQTIRVACESGELRGSQRRARGHWRIRRSDIDAWIESRAA